MTEREDRTCGVRAHIGSFTSAGGRGITTAAVDARTGALAVLGVTGGIADPSYLALGRGGRRLHAVSETERGAVRAFAVDGRGLPRPEAPAVPVGAAGPTHLAVAGEWLLTANYTSGSVSVLPADGTADGTATGPTAVLRHEGAGPDPERQAGPHAHQVVPDPSGRRFLSVDLGTDSIRVCTLDPATGAAALHAETALRPGSGPRHLAFHPGGGLLYVLHELEPLLTVCRWDADRGHVEPVREVPVAPPAAPGAVRAYPSAIVAAPDGRFLWAAVRGTDTIAVFALGAGPDAGPDAGPERPRYVGGVSCGGHWPRDLALDPAGHRLYAANERSGDVTWFDVDPDSGLPRRAGSLAVPAATCVVLG
ncbi:lactonase family protein [Streptomyces sp. NPDC089799]|uniref:lactonase family protein n=1 Tax=Streptomyces sp. NPDC089799 TaxID=3155066 RepID=UPI0034200819